MVTRNLRTLLLAAFEVTEDDLNANQQGILSKHQKTLIKRRITGTFYGLVGFSILMLVVIGIILWYLFNDPQYRLFKLAAIVVCIGLSAIFAGAARQAWKDIHSTTISMRLGQIIHGTSHPHFPSLALQMGIQTMQLSIPLKAMSAAYSLVGQVCELYTVGTIVVAIFPRDYEEEIIFKTTDEINLYQHNLNRVFGIANEQLATNKSGRLTHWQHMKALGYQLTKDLGRLGESTVESTSGYILMEIPHDYKENQKNFILHIQDRRLFITKKQFETLINGLFYCIYYLPKTRKVVAAELLVPPAQEDTSQPSPHTV